MIEVADEVGSNTRGTTRDRTAQAIHYYNNNVLKARTGSKSSSYGYQQLRFREGTSSNPRLDNLYRSNSNLELLHDTNFNECHPNNRSENCVNSSLKREYGSHGSIDVVSIVDQIKNKNDVSEQFFSMLREYKPATLDLVKNNRNCGRTSIEYDCVDGNTGKSENPISYNNNNNNNKILNKVEDDYTYSNKTIATSPKPKSKFSKFWSSGNMGSSSKNSNNDNSTSMSPLVTTYQSYNFPVNSNVNATNNIDVDEKQRRRAFAHYDCQSLIAKLGHDKLKNMLSKRRNTTTGASAASMIGTRSTTPDGDTGEDDVGDGRCNDLIENCPFFRNEIGGEEERIVSLTRSYSPSHSKHWKEPHHRPPLSCGISILEYPAGETHWINGTCPYRRNLKTIENVDEGALYYRKYFYKQDHQNWFGIDETLGPVAISVKREKVDINSSSDSSSTCSNPNGIAQLSRYRLVIRTSELQTLRGSVLEDAIPNLKPSHNIKNINTKEVLEYVIPEIQLSCLKLGINSSQIEEQLLKLDEQGLSRHYKIGVLYCRAGQATEEEMYNNEEGGPAFNEFLETIGQKVRLKGFDKYKAGLDNKSDSTGLYSVYAQYKDCEIMFHVSTMLPFTPNNRQQLLRKRHIGNDIVTIVFQEPGAQPFTPKNIRSQFQHVFIIVRGINPCSDCTQYRVAVTRSKDVALFGPPIPKDAIFNKSKSFAEFLLTKVINGENAAHCSDKFATMATRTRQAYLKDLTTNCTSSTLLENSQKFSIISFSSKKKERWKPRIVHDAIQRGAICWQVKLEDSTQSINIHCFLAISTDSLILIDENTNDIVFVTSCKSILGWSTQTNSLRLYYHAGECVTMHMRESSDRDELMEVVSRLKSVTLGSPALELSLKRNTVGQLGFHVQPDGIITQVENMGFAWQAGLCQGARLVEICKIAVATLTHDQMVDLLKTSLMVTVTVIPPLADGSPRRGCSVQNCKYSSVDDSEEYDNCSSPENQKLLLYNTASLQQPVIGKHKKMYERSFSPPRSSNSSGYGTGSSNRSYGCGNSSNKNHNIYSNRDIVSINGSNSHSAGDSWYDQLDPDNLPTVLRNNLSPPPLPARVLANVAPGTSRSSYKYSPHSKIKLSNSLSISNFNTSYSLPVVLNNENDLDYFETKDDFTSSDKITCIKKAECSHKVRTNLDKKFRNSGFKIDNYNVKDDTASSLPPENTKALFLNDGHSTDTSSTSEKAFPPSEDELSVESNGNASPKLKVTLRSTTSNSNNCSRNNSPRLKDVGEPRLRSGVNSRSSNRNSANFTSSTLQQDLMKLINPDDTQNVDEENKTTHSQMFLNIANDVRVENTPCEDLKVKENVPLIQKNSKTDNTVILTTARPATVISNSSSRSNESYTSKEERLSLRVTNVPNSKYDSSNNPLSDTKEMEWSSLTDNTSKGMLQLSNDENSSSLLSSTVSDNDLQWIDSSNEFHFSMNSGVDVKKSTQQQFQKYLSELENRLMKETQRRLTLEKEIHSLKDENRRLQQESQSSAEQLRRFTEWFFQTIDKQ